MRGGGERMRKREREKRCRQKKKLVRTVMYKIVKGRKDKRHLSENKLF